MKDKEEILYSWQKSKDGFLFAVKEQKREESVTISGIEINKAEEFFILIKENDVRAVHLKAVAEDFLSGLIEIGTE